ncbi:MAG: hypothetical protein DMF70_01030 [Acidobacteria bacterium]|nr:MAG: hypothetical protein DMF70_01030 [Acidobacteriota bacterium]
MKFVTQMLIILVAAGSALSQDNLKARDEGFARCNALMRDREARYKLCKDYLEKYTDDDYKHRETAEKFVRAYERVMSYAKALQAFAISQPHVWFVYEPDLKIELPNVDQTLSLNSYKIKIDRSFKTVAEAAMLKKAEAVYGPQFRYIDAMRSSPEQWADNLPDEITPLWGSPGNDNVQVTDVITASGIKYYYGISISSRAHQQFRNVFQMMSTSLEYTASVKHYDEWEHAYTKYRDVYVADLNLEWKSICGGLCGIGFTRNKLVVFDKKGEVVELYLDAAMNRTLWES